MPKKQFGRTVIKEVLFDASAMLDKNINSKIVQTNIIKRLKRLDNPSCNVEWD